MACFWMSGRVRWWEFEGRTGMGMAPDSAAIPPASLVWRCYFGSRVDLW